MSETSFVATALATAGAMYPQYQWTVSDGQLVAQLGAKERVSIRLHPLAVAPQGQSERLAALRRHIRAAVSSVEDTDAGPWEAERGRLYPMVRPASFLDWALPTGEWTGGLPDDAQACVFKWTARFCVACVLDRPRVMLHVSASRLRAWGITAEQAREVAFQNLGRKPLQVLTGRTSAGTSWLQVEPSSYTAACAADRHIYERFGAVLGPRFHIWLPAENMCIAHSGSAEPWRDRELVKMLTGAIRDDADKSHLLPFIGSVYVDVTNRISEWRPFSARPGDLSIWAGGSSDGSQRAC